MRGFDLSLDAFECGDVNKDKKVYTSVYNVFTYLSDNPLHYCTALSLLTSILCLSYNYCSLSDYLYLSFHNLFIRNVAFRQLFAFEKGCDCRLVQ